MFQSRIEGIILQPTTQEFESQAVLNPAGVAKDGVIHLFYRAVRPGNFSTIGHCLLSVDNQILQRESKPLLVPEHPYEAQGLEDPRIVFLDDVYYMFYTAYDGKNAMLALATSPDLEHWTKQGVISPHLTYDEAEDIFHHLNLDERYFAFEAYYKHLAGRDVLLWEKDSFLLPQKINGQFALFHRILPGIQLIKFNNFSDLTESFWRAHLREIDRHIVLEPKFAWESRNIGGGCPPLPTLAGWLFIYHAVEQLPTGFIYHAGAALLDKTNPQRVIGRLSQPLFSPQEPWEKEGRVANVVFPTSALIRHSRVYVYYGAADSLIACKSFDLNELLLALTQYGEESQS